MAKDMKKAVLIRPYTCAPSGHTVVTYPMGAEVDGAVALWALEDGAAIEAPGMAPLETKTEDAPRKRGRPPKVRDDE